VKNLTVSLPEAVIDRLKTMAAKQKMSVNRFVGEVLGEVTSGTTGDWRAAHSALYQEIKGLRSSQDWTREEIYE
jgi:hypothetical protein